MARFDDNQHTNGVDFFGNSEWPANSPDINPTENLGAILKDRVEGKMFLERSEDRLNVEIWKRHIDSVLDELKNDQELLCRLLTSMKRRVKSITEAQGGRIQY